MEDSEEVKSEEPQSEEPKPEETEIVLDESEQKDREETKDEQKEQKQNEDEQKEDKHTDEPQEKDNTEDEHEMEDIPEGERRPSESEKRASEGGDSITYSPVSETKEADEETELFTDEAAVPQTVMDTLMPEHDDTVSQMTEATDGAENEVEATDAEETEKEEAVERDSKLDVAAVQKRRATITESGKGATERTEEEKAEGGLDLELMMSASELAAEKKYSDTRDRASCVTIATQKSVGISESGVSAIKRPKTKRGMRPHSLIYDLRPRFRSEEDDLHRPSGDFGVAPDQDAETVKYYVYMDDKEVEEEELAESEEEEEIVRIDRGPYYVKHLNINFAIRNEKILSSILQKKLSYFFKRRNMAHVLRETDQQYDTQQKYGKKLDTYGELVEIDRIQRNAIAQELNILKEKREEKFKELNKLFNDMQEREKEIGSGLINAKTGNPIPDKLIERLIRRQKIQMEQVSSMRLNYLQLKEMTSEKESAIESLDRIGEGLHLMDYEQLKVENRSNEDKIEEKEEELTRLRFKCQNTIQILAHIREKSSALDSDIDDIKEDMSMIQLQSVQLRGQLNGAKQERDHYRLMTNKLREESGLLTQPTLLRDMESSMEELKTLSVELENLKEENKKKAQQIRNIRRNLEFTTDDTGLRKKSVREILPKSVVKQHVYKGRPSLCKPSLPQDAFDYLKEFKPKVHMIKNKKKK